MQYNRKQTCMHIHNESKYRVLVVVGTTADLTVKEKIL